MIPLRDHNPSQTTPFTTYTILALNAGVFLYMFGLPERRLMQFIEVYALEPVEIIRGIDLFSLISSMFLHGSIAHIVGNMLFLHIFGDNLEDALGHVRYGLYYLLCGIGGALLQIIVNPASSIPNLGASGAIAGLMGGYLVLFPHHRIDVLIPFGFFLSRTTVPAYTMLFYWFIIQFLSGLGDIGSPLGGIAYFAHIGGFLTGLLLVRLFQKRYLS